MEVVISSLGVIIAILSFAYTRFRDKKMDKRVKETERNIEDINTRQKFVSDASGKLDILRKQKMDFNYEAFPETQYLDNFYEIIHRISIKEYFKSNASSKMSIVTSSLLLHLERAIKSAKDKNQDQKEYDKEKNECKTLVLAFINHLEEMIDK